MRRKSPGKGSKTSLSFLPEDAGIDLVKFSFCLFTKYFLYLGLVGISSRRTVGGGFETVKLDSWVVNEKAMELWNFRGFLFFFF